jgi:glycerophosphoryl diester phosphodiesterase
VPKVRKRPAALALRSHWVIALALSTLNMNASDLNLPALKLVASQRPLVIGHRGFCHLAPENTLPSFRLAMEAGADLVELDYHHTSDGKLIVIHDSELDRTTDARRRWSEKHIMVEARTASEIQSLDAGSWFDPQFAGTRVPLLAEALDRIRQGGVALIERKTGDPAACIALLREKDLINKVIVQSFDWQYLRAFHEQAPEQMLGALGPPARLSGGEKPSRLQKRLDAKWLDELQKTGAKAVVWNKKLTSAAVQLAHLRGLKVWVYTVNEGDLANKLLDIGVDGIITNDPSLIGKAIAKRRQAGRLGQETGKAPSAHNRAVAMAVAQERPFTCQPLR